MSLVGADRPILSTSGSLFGSTYRRSVCANIYIDAVNIRRYRHPVRCMQCYFGDVMSALLGRFGPGKACKLLENTKGIPVAGELSPVSAARTDKKSRANEWVNAPG
jgi:hypothetical protein